MPTGNPGRHRIKSAKKLESILNQQMIDAIRVMLGLEPLYSISRDTIQTYQSGYSFDLGDGGIRKPKART